MIGPTVLMIIAMLACLPMLGALGTLAHTGIPGVIVMAHDRMLSAAVLQHFAALAADVLREKDLIRRIDGEEFAVLYPDLRLDAACYASEKRPQALTERAQRALRLAREGGRDRIAAQRQPQGAG